MEGEGAPRSRERLSDLLFSPEGIRRRRAGTAQKGGSWTWPRNGLLPGLRTADVISGWHCLGHSRVVLILAVEQNSYQWPSIVQTVIEGSRRTRLLFCASRATSSSLYVWMPTLD